MLAVVATDSELFIYRPVGSGRWWSLQQPYASFSQPWSRV